ncbi:MAG: hypothetical protein GYA24_03820, partial [Candidatus Lokiarchaeota archaeon]|nr:hypothetical protein [Candidatus Lokiarchaeota archaeon]
SSNDPAPVTVPGTGSIVQSFTVTVQGGATPASVIIGATWTGTEDASGRSLSGSSIANQTVQITNEVLVINRVSGARAFTAINDGMHGENTTIAIGASFVITVGVRNLAASPVTVDRITLTFWRQSGVVQAGFTGLVVNNPGVVAASGTSLFTLTVQAPLGNFGPADFDREFALTALVNYTFGGPASYNTEFEIYNQRDSIVVVESFLSVSLHSASPGLSFPVLGANVDVNLTYRVTSDCWEPISLSLVNIALSTPAYVVGGLSGVVVPSSGSVTIGAFGSVLVSVTFTIDYTQVTVSDTLTVSFDVENADSSKGLSTESVVQTLFLSVIVPVDSWALRVIRANGTEIYNGSNVVLSFYDSFVLYVNSSIAGLSIQAFIFAADNGSVRTGDYYLFENAPGEYSFTWNIANDFGRSHPLVENAHWLNFSFGGNLHGNVAYLLPRSPGFTTLNVAGDPINVASSPIVGLVEATLASWVRATFTNSWTHAVQVQAYYGLVDPASVDISQVYPVPLTFVFSAGTWNQQVSRSTPGVEPIWQAGRTSTKLYFYFNVTDTYGNYYTAGEINTMPCLELRIVDRIAPVLDLSALNALAGSTIFKPSSSYEVSVKSVVEPGASFTRTVVLYYSTTQPSSNTLAAWQAAGAKSLKLSLI